MTRTYIKLRIGLGFSKDAEGGVYADKLEALRSYSGGRATLLTFGKDFAIVHKPLAEVEQMLFDAQAAQTAVLNWRDISGNELPKPEKKSGGGFRLPRCGR